MTYVPVVLYTLDGDFLGYAIKAEHNLQSIHLYAESESNLLNEQIARLNQSVSLKEHWPHPQDPEVMALTDNPDFMPLEYVKAEVVDDDHSYYVYKKKTARDPETNRLIKVESDEIDEEASVLVFKVVDVPKMPTDVVRRIKGACEEVAKRRAGLLKSQNV